MWAVMYTFWLPVYMIELSRCYTSLSLCVYMFLPYFSDSVFCSIWIKVFVQAVELVIYIITLPLTRKSIIATHTCIILCFFLLPPLSFLLFFPLFCDCPADVLMSASGYQQEFLWLLFDMTFFFVVIIILLAIIQGQLYLSYWLLLPNL